MFLYKISLSNYIILEILLVIYVHVCKIMDAWPTGIHYTQVKEYFSMLKDILLCLLAVAVSFPPRPTCWWCLTCYCAALSLLQGDRGDRGGPGVPWLIDYWYEKRRRAYENREWVLEVVEMGRGGGDVSHADQTVCSSWHGLAMEHGKQTDNQ